MPTTIPLQTGLIDWNVKQGSTFRKTVFWKTGTDLTNLTPVDLTGYTARMKIRINKYDLQPVYELTTGDGLTIDGENGAVEIYIPATDTETFTWTKAKYDLELVSGGDVYTLAQGDIFVTQEATR